MEPVDPQAEALVAAAEGQLHTPVAQMGAAEVGSPGSPRTVEILETCAWREDWQAEEQRKLAFEGAQTAAGAVGSHSAGRTRPRDSVVAVAVAAPERVEKVVPVVVVVEKVAALPLAVQPEPASQGYYSRLALEVEAAELAAVLVDVAWVDELAGVAAYYAQRTCHLSAAAHLFEARSLGHTSTVVAALQACLPGELGQEP